MRPDLEELSETWRQPRRPTPFHFSVSRSQYMSILVPFHAQKTSSYCPYALIVLARFPPLHHVRGSEREDKLSSPLTYSRQLLHLSQLQRMFRDG